MKQLEWIHKIGVPAVLFFWLGSVQLQLSAVQEKYDDCQEARINDARTAEQKDDRMRWFAVLPKKPRVKKEEG